MLFPGPPEFFQRLIIRFFKLTITELSVNTLMILQRIQLKPILNNQTYIIFVILGN